MRELAAWEIPPDAELPRLAANLAGWRETFEQSRRVARAHELPARLRSKLKRAIERAEESIEVMEAIVRLWLDEHPHFPGSYVEQLTRAGVAKGKRPPAIPAVFFDEAREVASDFAASLASAIQKLPEVASRVSGKLVTIGTPHPKDKR